MTHQTDPKMVNISSDTVVRVLEEISRIDSVEQRQLFVALAASVDTPISMAPAKIPEGIEILQKAVRQVMAERLILGDCSLPLVDRSRVAEIFRLAMTADEEMAGKLTDDESAGFIDAAIDAFVETSVKDTDIESQHKKAWKRIHAFLALEAEIGPLDPDSQEHRDEFIRRSVTAQEWSRTTGQAVRTAMEEMMSAMRTRLLPVMQQMFGMDVTQEELDEDWGELEKFIEPIIRQFAAAVQARQDERYIELWTIPSMKTDQ